MPKDNEAPVEVIQGDIDRASELCGTPNPGACNSDDYSRAKRMFDAAVNLFARHRLAYQSEAPAQGEGIGESGPLPRESAGKEILIRAKICYPGSAVSDIMIGGSLPVQISNEALRSALAKPSLPLADREAIAREAFSGHDRMYKEGLDRWRAIADRTNGHDIMPINATSVRRLIATIDCLLSLPPSPVGEGIPEIGTRCNRCGIAAPRAIGAACNRPECEWRRAPPTPAPVRGE